MSLNFTLKDKTDWHNQALWHVRQKRDHAVNEIGEWEYLRDLASQVKDHTLSKLDTYLIQFEEKAIANGVHVHWAENASEHNQIVWNILEARGVKRMVKSKSMLTEECGLNEFLETRDIEVTDTDLGERIIQMLRQPPSHIVMPAIHLKKEEIGQLFSEQLHSEKGNSDPKYLTEVARQHLRKKFLEADAALTGVNFGIAETGGVVVCTNEGNADMGVHSAPIQIHSMGIEKIIPLASHLGIFTRLLARSATGQPITIYTSHYHRPRLDSEMHIIIVDNGRSKHLGREEFREGLKCIRCGACMNTCPVYRRSGGHSYRATVPGPIGSILNPGINLEEYNDLPFASSLCGSCSDICPVKINIHEQLYRWRQHIGDKEDRSFWTNQVLRLAVKTLSNPKTYAKNSMLLKILLWTVPAPLLKFLPYNKWSKGRDLPKLPVQSFKSWYRKNKLHV